MRRAALLVLLVLAFAAFVAHAVVLGGRRGHRSDGKKLDVDSLSDAVFDEVSKEAKDMYDEFEHRRQLAAQRLAEEEAKAERAQEHKEKEDRHTEQVTKKLHEQNVKRGEAMKARRAREEAVKNAMTDPTPPPELIHMETEVKGSTPTVSTMTGLASISEESAPVDPREKVYGEDSASAQHAELSLFRGEAVRDPTAPADGSTVPATPVEEASPLSSIQASTV